MVLFNELIKKKYSNNKKDYCYSLKVYYDASKAQKSYFLNKRKLLLFFNKIAYHKVQEFSLH